MIRNGGDCQTLLMQTACLLRQGAERLPVGLINIVCGRTKF